MLFNNYECEECHQRAEIPLCEECYEEFINAKQNNINNRFYDENKVYEKRKSISTKKERIFYKIADKTLNKDEYVIIPQISLQAIVDVKNSNRRNDELFRNIDFGIFRKDDLYCILLVEINDYRHYENEYIKQRDESVKSILKEIYLPLLTLTNEEIVSLAEEEIAEIISKAVKYAENYLTQSNDILDITTENIDKLQ